MWNPLTNTCDHDWEVVRENYLPEGEYFTRHPVIAVEGGEVTADFTITEYRKLRCSACDEVQREQVGERRFRFPVEEVDA